MSNTLAGDTDELEALFDSILASNSPQAEVAAPAVAETASAANEAQSSPALVDGNGAITEPFYSQIGHLTRKLHDTMHELGYDKSLEKAVDSTIPDARDRLNYIATLTAKAADRVLNATDVAKPLQEKIEEDSAKLSAQWDRLFNNELSIDDFKALVGETRTFLGSVSNSAKTTNAQLIEIMMAQDFQDLTGQVIKKITDMAKDMENQLVGLLLNGTPPEKRAEMDTGLLNGPVINADGRNDIVANQEQVDDLLESLGF